MERTMKSVLYHLLFTHPNGTHSEEGIYPYWGLIPSLQTLQDYHYSPEKEELQTPLWAY